MYIWIDMKKILLALLFVIFTAGLYAQYDSKITIETLLKTDTTSIGQKINYPLTQHPEVSICKITIPPGASTGWHLHNFPVFAYVEKGTLTVESENGKKLQFNEGQSFSEMIGLKHNGINNGTEDVVLFAVFMGEKNKPLSVH
jgi:quercetin dioxygenase-like cupin family protein